MFTTKTRIRDVARKANDAFWKVVAEEFPQVETGDLDPMTDHCLRLEMERAIENWWNLNSPKD